MVGFCSWTQLGPTFTTERTNPIEGWILFVDPTGTNVHYGTHQPDRGLDFIRGPNWDQRSLRNAPTRSRVGFYSRTQLGPTFTTERTNPIEGWILFSDPTGTNVHYGTHQPDRGLDFYSRTQLR